jgi:hypothetical protein
MKTSTLTGAALDWAVAKCEGITPIAVKKKYSEGHILYSFPASTVPLEYASKWAQGGPIIEREGLLVRPEPGKYWSSWVHGADNPCYSSGPAPLIAAMRCYVASKLGDEIEIPKELL